MITLALRLELKTLLRSPLRLLVLAFVLGLGVFVLLQGQADVERWQDAIAAGQRAQDEALTEARGFFAEGKAGPEDRPWVDLTQAKWQDRYAATRIARTPAPLAGIAFASAESAPATFHLDRFADPLLAQGSRIENPALVAAGGLDMVTVLALVLPLVIVALGVEVGGYERANGVLRLVRVQAGRDLRWLRARCIAIGLLVAGVAVVLVALTAAASEGGVVDTLALGVLVLAYVAVWTALLTTVATISRNPSQGAVLLGSAWIALCVLVPSIAAERSSSLAAGDLALDLTIDKRAARSEDRKRAPADVIAAVVARFPDLAAVPHDTDSSSAEVAADALRLIDLEARMRQRDEQGASYRRLMTSASIASPTIAFSEALERLAGRGPEASRAFRTAVVSAAAARMERTVASGWKAETLGLDEFDALVAESPQSVAPPDPHWEFELAVLVAWTLALYGASWGLARDPSA